MTHGRGLVELQAGANKKAVRAVAGVYWDPGEVGLVSAVR